MKNLNFYWEYFKYIIVHKGNVIRSYYLYKPLIDNKNISRKLFWRCIFHDISKLNPKEFIPYTKRWKMQLNDTNTLISYKYALWRHYDKNKHHPEHWDGQDMDEVSVLEMLCDWMAMSIKFNNTPQEYYFKNRNNLNFSRNTRILVEHYLGFIDKRLAENNNVTWEEYCNKYGLKPLDEFNKKFGLQVENNFTIY